MFPDNGFKYPSFLLNRFDNGLNLGGKITSKKAFVIYSRGTAKSKEVTMPRGGYREKGAFKKGNLAALKHGRYSKNIQELLKASSTGEVAILDKKEGLKVFKLVPKGKNE